MLLSVNQLSRQRPFVAVTCAAALVTGCVSPGFREAMGQFGTLTKQTVTQQNSRLSSLVASEEERYRQQLAANRVDLRLNAACTQALSAGSDAVPRVAVSSPTCWLQLPDGQRLESAPRFTNVLALGSAIEDYADALSCLAGDQQGADSAFSASLTKLATSLGGLNNTVRSIAGQQAQDHAERLGTIANLVARAGTLYFAHQRERALRRIIIQGDPILQEAVGLLGQSQSYLSLYERTDLARRALAAQDRASSLAAGTKPVAELRTAQNELFNAVAAYNAHGADVKRFQAIGAAHTKLTSAARKGASAVELRAAIEALIDLASTAHEVVTARESGEQNNAYSIEQRGRVERQPGRLGRCSSRGV